MRRCLKDLANCSSSSRSKICSSLVQSRVSATSGDDVRRFILLFWPSFMLSFCFSALWCHFPLSRGSDSWLRCPAGAGSYIASHCSSASVLVWYCSKLSHLLVYRLSGVAQLLQKRLDGGNGHWTVAYLSPYNISGGRLPAKTHEKSAKAKNYVKLSGQVQIPMEKLPALRWNDGEVRFEQYSMECSDRRAVTQAGKSQSEC